MTGDGKKLINFMKTIAHIIVTHAVFLALFAGAAFAFAQEEGGTTDDGTVAGGITADETTDMPDSAIENPDGDEPDSTIPPRNARPVPTNRNSDFAPMMEARQADVEAKKEDRQAAIEERQAVMEEKKEERQAAMEERKAQLQARTQERITNLAANISNRMDSAIARIQNIIDRVQSRIEKLNEYGVDTAAAEAELQRAQEQLDTASAAIADIDNDVTAAVTSEDVRSSWDGVKNKYGSIRENLKQARTQLQATVAALKEAVKNTEGLRKAGEAVRNDGTMGQKNLGTEEETEDDTETDSEIE